MADEKFSFQKFLDDSKNAILNPKDHFSKLSTTGGFGEPVIKAVIYGFVAGVFALLWSLLNISGAGAFGELFGGAVGIMAFIGAIIGALIGLFIGGVIVLIISAICSGSNDYEANVRVVAALMVLTPVNAFLNVFNDISPALGNVLGLVVNLYGLWMLYHALNQTLKAKPETSKVLSIVLAAIVLLFAIIEFATRKVVDKKLGEYEEATSKITEDYVEAAKEMTEKTEEVAEQISEEYGDTKGDFEFEMANGETLETINTISITMALKNLDEDNDFAILSKGESFVQTALGEDGYLAEYRDDSGYFRSVESDIPFEKVLSMFLGFLNENDLWKEGMEWEEAE